MARTKVSPIAQEELYPPDEPVREELDDARVLDLEAEEESPFLRGQKRVSVRRGSLPKKTATRLTWAAVAAVLLFFATVAASALYHYGEHSWRFRVESSDDIEIAGTENVTRSQVVEVMGGDIGRNIFFIPLAQRKLELERIPWVESASVMRFVPNHLRVEIHERTPVAFARVGSRILLVDAAGTLMELPLSGKRKYSFPVVVGMNPGEPLSTRAPRMKIYSQLVSDLDSGGTRYSQDVSEVDLSDPEDVKVLASSPGGEVLVHLGSSNYLERYKIYVSHLQEWRAQFDKLQSVDLRFDRQIVVNPDLHGTVKQSPLSASAARAAVAAGVKPAALVSRTIGPARSGSPAVPGPKPVIHPAVVRHVVKAPRRRPVAKGWKPSGTTVAKAATAAPPGVIARPAPATPAKAVNDGAGKKPSPAIKDSKDQGHP